jgi:hypothetical protein
MFKTTDRAYRALQNVNKETNDEEIWILITPYGQGQPCWPYIFIRRLRNKSTPIKFLSIRRGACEI